MYLPAGTARKNKLIGYVRDASLQGRLIWLDAEANLAELSNREGVRNQSRQCAHCGANAVIVDVKPLSGYVLFHSQIAPRLSDAPDASYPSTHDLLTVASEEARAAGLAVFAAINVFAEGSQRLGHGTAFSHPNWQCSILTPEGLMPAACASETHHAVFVSPHIPNAVDYELSIISEICCNYDVDGIVLDRMRFPGIYADFGISAREGFERIVGHIPNWPDAVMVRAGDQVKHGPLFGEWLKFRACAIRMFLESAVHIAHDAGKKVGVYVGSWYPEYYDVGVNWGSPNHIANYEWWPTGYERCGYADIPDFIMPGCYYPYPTRDDAQAAGVQPWHSVEAGAEESNHAIDDAAAVFASVYVRDYKSRPDELKSAISECLRITQGCMLFDLVQIREYGFWDVLREVFPVANTVPLKL